MQGKRTLAVWFGVLSIIIGCFLQWFGSHMAYQNVEELSHGSIDFAHAVAQADPFGYLTSIGTQLTYFGFALITIAIYAWLQAPSKVVQN